MVKEVLGKLAWNLLYILVSTSHRFVRRLAEDGGKLKELLFIVRGDGGVCASVPDRRASRGELMRIRPVLQRI